MEENFPFYRITHIRNVPIVLTQGLWSYNSGRVDKSFISIGNPDLSTRRADLVVPVAPGGSLGDYVHFYFGTRSPMLYNVQHGYGVQKHEAADIVYLCFRRRVLIEHQLRWCFTDGHARDKLSRFYPAGHGLHVLDHQAILADNWGTPEVSRLNPDLRRRKQAELLIHTHVPPEAIVHIFTATSKAAADITQIVLNLGLRLSVSPANYQRFYY